MGRWLLCRRNEGPGFGFVYFAKGFESPYVNSYQDGSFSGSALPRQYHWMFCKSRSKRAAAGRRPVRVGQHALDTAPERGVYAAMWPTSHSCGVNAGFRFHRRGGDDGVLRNSNWQRMERGSASRRDPTLQNRWKFRGSLFQPGRCGSQTRAPFELGNTPSTLPQNGARLRGNVANFTLLPGKRGVPISPVVGFDGARFCEPQGSNTSKSSEISKIPFPAGPLRVTDPRSVRIGQHTLDTDPERRAFTRQCGQLRTPAG